MADQNLGGRTDTYRLIRRLRSSPTGELFEAAHPRLPGRYVIKILNRNLMGNPQVLTGFRAEVERTIALRHPNIVQVVELGAMPDGTPFCVMELLEGMSLEERLAHGPLSPVEAAVVIKSIAAGLHAAHVQGLMHLALAPRRIFLAAIEGHDGGFPKLLGFGAWRLRAALAASGGMSDANEVRYLAPEQAMGRHDLVDARADEFALAALAYKMLSGIDPFRGDDSITVLYQIVHEAPRPLAEIVAADPRLDAVVQTGLAKDKNARFESALAFARAFQEAAAGRGSVMMPLGPASAQAAAREPAYSRQSMASASADDLQGPFLSDAPDSFSDLDDDLEVPRNKFWKVPVVGFLIGGAAVLALLGTGWRPPHAWRQSSLWHTLHLPGAESVTASLPGPAAVPAAPVAGAGAAAPVAITPPATAPGTAAAAPAAEAVPPTTAATVETTPVPAPVPIPGASPAAAAVAPVTAAAAAKPAVPPPTPATGPSVVPIPAVKPTAAADRRVPAAAEKPGEPAAGVVAAPRPRGKKASGVPLAGMVWSETEQRLVPIGGGPPGAAASPPSSAPPPAAVTPAVPALAPPPPQ